MKWQPTLIVSMFAFLTGCAGTMHSRVNDDGAFFGKPVYAAVAEDYRVTFYGVGHGASWLGHYNMLKPFSLPLDLLFDTVFLPADLIAWSMGYSKFLPMPQNEKEN